MREEARRFTEKELWVYAYEIALAISFMHSKNIIHRDIKCLNLFLTATNHIKLGDLGASKITSPVAQMHATRVGTPLYLAPELVKQKAYDFKVDIWALGCVMYHLSALAPPFMADNLIALGHTIVHKRPKPLPGHYSSRYVGMIMKLLEKKPEDRPDIQ
jgi:NIMA (never in mitosis gene a)-related kinase